MSDEINIEGEIIKIDPNGKYVLQCLTPNPSPGTLRYLRDEWLKFREAPAGALFILGGNFRLIKIKEDTDEA